MEKKRVILILSIVLLIILTSFYIAHKISDSSYCYSLGSIIDTSKRNDCYQYFAIKTKSLWLCDRIQYQLTKDSCYWNVAREKSDISICEKIPTLESREWCYQEIAIETENSTICDKISSLKAKDKCHRDFKCYMDINITSCEIESIFNLSS